MKTIDEVLKSDRIVEPNSREFSRFIKFVPNDKLKELDLDVTDETRELIPFTRENVLKELTRDLRFGWEKVEDERNISSFLMARVVCFWDWILEDDPAKLVFLDDEDYARDTFVELSKKYHISLEA